MKEGAFPGQGAFQEDFAEQEMLGLVPAGLGLEFFKLTVNSECGWEKAVQAEGVVNAKCGSKPLEPTICYLNENNRSWHSGAHHLPCTVPNG